MEFPKHLYVSYIEYGDGTEFIATEDYNSHSVVGEKTKTAIYELKCVGGVVTEPVWVKDVE